MNKDHLLFRDFLRLKAGGKAFASRSQLLKPWKPLLIITLAFIPLVLAWSSKSFPPCEPIHQEAIENVLSNQVSPELITVLQDQQRIVDQDQQPTNSFEHSMTGIANANETTNTQTPIYITETETFIHEKLTAAMSARTNGDVFLAFTNLGKAMHPLEDATSPAHLPFQAWKYNESLWEEIKHVSKEYSYPDNTNDVAQLKERIQLEGSVQYAYDIMMGKTAMPDRFFDHTTGLLLLPPAYLHLNVK